LRCRQIIKNNPKSTVPSIYDRQRIDRRLIENVLQTKGTEGQMHLATCNDDVDDDAGRITDDAGQVETHRPFLHKLYLPFFSSLLYTVASGQWDDCLNSRIIAEDSALVLYDQWPFVLEVYLILIQSHFESDQDGDVIGK